MFGFSSSIFDDTNVAYRASLIAVSGLVLMASVYLYANTQANEQTKKHGELLHLEKTANEIIKDIAGANIRLKNHEPHTFDKTVIIDQLEQYQASLFKHFNLLQTYLDKASISRAENPIYKQVYTHRAFVNDLSQRYDVLGTDENSGLRGRMNLIAQRIETELATSNHLSLRRELALIRQYTAGFITKGDKQFALSLEQSFGQFSRLLGMASGFGNKKLKILQLVHSYKKTFNDYGMTLDGFQKQVQQQEAIYQSLLSNVIGVSDLAVREIANTRLLVDALNQRTNRYEMVLIALVVVLLTGAGIFITRSIFLSLAKFSNNDGQTGSLQFNSTLANFCMQSARLHRINDEMRDTLIKLQSPDEIIMRKRKQFGSEISKTN